MILSGTPMALSLRAANVVSAAVSCISLPVAMMLSARRFDWAQSLRIFASPQQILQNRRTSRLNAYEPR
jgi:hypothetical protein